MLEFGVVNLFVLAIYLLGVTVIGSFAARWIGGISDFIMPRRFGKSMLIMHSFGTGTHSDQAVSVARKSYTNGLSGIWYQWLWLFATPFYWLIAPMMRRTRAVTIGDIFEARFGRSASIMYALLGMAMMLSIIGLMLKGSAAVISAATGQALSPDVCIGVVTVLFVIYGAIGGLSGAIVTDFIQGIMTIVFSFLLLPSVLAEVGWIDGMRATIDDPQMFSLVTPGEIGAFYIAVIALNALIGIIAQPHALGNCAAGRTEAEGQVGWMFGNMLKRLCTVAWSLTGLAAIAYFAQRGIDPDTFKPDLIYGMMAHEELPELLPGLLGLFVASLLATLMSSCDSFMVASSGLFTENLYKKILPGKSDRHYIWVARAAALVVVASSVTYAYWLKDVRQGLKIFWKLAPMAGIALWMGFLWKRMTVQGAWASALSAVATWWVTSQAWFVEWLAGTQLSEQLQFVVSGEEGLAMYLPWQMVFYLAVGVGFGVVVSLLTRRTPQHKLDHFYALLRTPIRPGEEHDVHEACTLPEDAETPPEETLLPGTDIYLPKPSARGIIGFMVGWACVAAIIAIVYYIAVA